MSRTRKNLNLTRKRTVFIVVLLLICLIAIYTFNFSTKSEVVPKTTMSFSELGTELKVTDDLEFYEDEEGSYVVFPERVAGYQVKQYLVPNVYEIEKVEEIEEDDTNTTVENEVTNTTTNTDSNTSVENEVTNDVLDNNTVNNTINTNTLDSKTNTVENAVTNTTSNENVISDNTTVEKTAVVGETNTHETSQELEVDEEEIDKDSEENVPEIENNETVEENEKTENTNTVVESGEENTVVENTVSNNKVEETKTEEPVAEAASSEEPHEEGKEETEDKEEELQTKELSNIIYYDESSERDTEDANVEGMTSYKPGDKVYFSKEDIDSNNIQITVVFKTIRINGVDLYNQELIEDTGVSIIKVTGYIPAEFKLEINAEDKERIEELKSDVEELKDTTVLVAYDIKIKKDDVEYQPMNYFQAVDVSICSPTEFENNLINNEVTILHIKEDYENNEIIFEKVAVDVKTEDTVECRTNEFSTYAVVKNNNRTVDSFTVYDFDSDYNYYIGKSIVERNCTYPSVYDDSNSNMKLAKFVVNYYSYDSSRTPNDSVNLASDEYTLSSTTTYTDSHSDRNYPLGTNPQTYGYSYYNRTYTINFTLDLADKKYIDTSKPWEISFDVPSNIIVNQLSNLNNTVTPVYDSDAGKLRISGNTFESAWTRTNISKYTFSYNVTFNIMKDDHTGYNNMNLPVSNKSLVGAKRLLIGYISNREKNANDANDYGERQVLMSYVIAVPVNTANHTASIELIDNPYMDRPAEFGFNGWLVNNSATQNTFTTRIDTDSETFIQTLKIENLTYTENATYTIDLNADWLLANIIYIQAGAGNNNGLTPNTPTDTIAHAVDKLNGIYKNSPQHTVSDRELNILVLIGGEVDFSIPSRAVTITSLYNKTDYRNSARIRFNNSYSLTKDLQMDFVTLYDNTTVPLTSTTLNNIHRVNNNNIACHILSCNNYNLRIGRGMMPQGNYSNRFTITQIEGGTTTGNNTNQRKFKLVTETGRYELISVGKISRVTYDRQGRVTHQATDRLTHNGIEVVGCDFDRMNNNNDDFYIYCRIMSKSAGAGTTANQYAYSHVSDPNYDLYKIIVKSGTIGTDYFTSYINDEDSDYPYCGIYIGGAQTSLGYDFGDRTLIVEGGNIANINGGLKVDTNNRVKTNIFVKGGTVVNITAGAGRTATYGDRYVCVTGGTIRYSVNGGSNGVYSEDNDNNGSLGGNTYVYVGGNAVIGGNAEIANGGSYLYGTLAGSVLGAGNGNENYKGSVDSTHVVIDGNATVNGNVFGGGNYSVVGNNYNNSVDFTVQAINFHNINGPVTFSVGETYLLGNGTNFANQTNQASTNDLRQTRDLISYSWTIESAGGNTYYIKNAETGEYLYRNNRNNLTYSTTNRQAFTYQNNRFRFDSGFYTYYLIVNNAGLAYTNSNTTANTSAVRTYSYTDNDVPEITGLTDVGTTKAQIDIYGGTVKKDVYGGSNQSDVYGTTVINMSADSTQTTYEVSESTVVGTVEGNIYGGSNVSGTIHSSAVINIKSGTVGTSHTSNLGDYDAVFGGGKGYQTYINGNTIVNITDEKGNVTINGCVYGGSEQGRVLLSDNVYVGDHFSDTNEISLNGNVYGGGKGSNTTGNVHAASTGRSATVTIDGGDFNKSTNGIVQVYGGCNVLGSVGGNITVKVGENYPTEVYQVYGGGNQAEVTTSTMNVDVVLYKNATVDEAFNGGNAAGIQGTQEQTKRSISAIGATVGDLYGGSNTSGTLVETHVLVENGAKIDNVYGGGLGENTDITGDTYVVINGYDRATLNGDPSLTNTQITEDVYGGGSDGTVGGNTNVEINNTDVVGNVYGGGYGENSTETTPLATVSGNTQVTIDGSTIGSNVYGSGYGGKVEGSTSVDIEKSDITGDVFGGGYGETATVGTESAPTSTSVTVSGSDSDNIRSTATNVYGGGDRGKVFGDTIVSVSLSTIDEDIYGGGDNADITGDSAVTLLNKTTATNVYGGGNEGSVEGSTSVGIYEDSVISNNVFGGGNKADVDGGTTVVVDDSIINNTIFGGGQSADVDNTSVTVQNGTVASKVFGGGDLGEVKGTTTGLQYATKVNISESTIINDVYAGGNGDESTSPNGKVSGNTSLTITDSIVGTTISESVDTTDDKAVAANVNGTGNVFGAGCGSSAVVTGNTKIVIDNSTIKKDVYGGGNNGSVSGSTDVELNKAVVGGSAYAAGNGEHATVGVGTHIVAHNESKIGESIFGGGNKALTGDYSSGAVVDIVGAEIGKNVYGSSNHSAIYGDATVNIGKKAVDDYYGTTTTYQKSKILITGTVYGGGESFNPESTSYDFDTVSVEGNILITIDGTGYDTSTTDPNTINILGSVFGSGNASRAGIPDGYDGEGRKKYIQNNGNIYIKNFGTADNVKELVSIQRGGQQDETHSIDNEVVIENSVMYLSGTTDSTSAHPTDQFSLNRLGMLKLKGGAIIYLVNGTNLVEEYQSLASDGTPAEIIIENSVISNNSDEINKIYMHEGVNFNVAKTENVSVFGKVTGMSFIGLFTEEEGNMRYTGMYEDGYTPSGTYIAFADRDFAGAYAVGLHTYPDHDITKDGFFTVFEKFTTEPDPAEEMKEEYYDTLGATPYIDYITPTPDEDVYYMWYCGPETNTKYFNVSLVASKYSTLGVKELSLTGVSYSNASVTIKSVEAYMNDEDGDNVDIELKPRADIPNINSDEDAANNHFALAMKTGNVGWSMNGMTSFLYEYDDNVGERVAKSDGTTTYLIENSTVSPTLNFYLYSSNNLTEAKTIGRYRINMDVSYRIDDYKLGTAKIIIDCQLSTKMYDDNGYNSAITPGKQFDIFTSTETNITSDSSFSGFFEFAEPNFTDFLDDKGFTSLYENSYRLITTDYAFPENSTITMIDISSGTPKYYYYVVTAADEANSKTSYRLSEFLEMGSTNKHYDEEAMSASYLSAEDFEYEAFIFICDFAEADFGTTDQLICKNQLFRFYLNATDTTILNEGTPDEEVITSEETLLKMLDDQIERNNYSIYNAASIIDVDARLSNDRVYTGSNTTLTVDTSYQVVILDSSRIHDTKHFDEKLGVKLIFYKLDNEGNYMLDEHGNKIQVSGSELLGSYFTVGNSNYYPRADGTTRIKIADKVSNASTPIIFNIGNSSLNGRYEMVIESFGSADGVYYGIESSASTTVRLYVLDALYGLDAHIPEEQVIVDMTTGFTSDEDGYISTSNKKLDITVDYSSQLAEPVITASLYRRQYTDTNPVSMDYNIVDLQEYVTDTLDSIDTSPEGVTSSKIEYYAFNTSEITSEVADQALDPDPVTGEIPEDPDGTQLSFTYNLDKPLVSGTYKLVYTLYDHSKVNVYNTVVDETTGTISQVFDHEADVYSYIGDTFVYIVIK